MKVNHLVIKPHEVKRDWI